MATATNSSIANIIAAVAAGNLSSNKDSVINHVSPTTATATVSVTTTTTTSSSSSSSSSSPLSSTTKVSTTTITESKKTNNDPQKTNVPTQTKVDSKSTDEQDKENNSQSILKKSLEKPPIVKNEDSGTDESSIDNNKQEINNKENASFVAAVDQNESKLNSENINQQNDVTNHHDLDKSFKEKLSSIMDLAAKFASEDQQSSSPPPPTASPSKVIKQTPDITDLETSATVAVAAEYHQNLHAAAVAAAAAAAAGQPNPFFFQNFNSNIQEAALKVLQTAATSNSTNSPSIGIDLSSVTSKIDSNSGSVNVSNSNNHNTNQTDNENDTEIDPNNYIIDLSSNSNNLVSGNTSVVHSIEASIVPLNSSLDSNPTPAKRRKRSNWNVETEKAFVKYWRQYYSELKKSKRTSVVYQKIADELNKFGLALTCRDVQVKTHNMTQKYRHERRLIYKSGGKPSSWPVYDEVHELIGHLYKDDAKPETIKEEQNQPNGILAGPSSPKPPKLEQPTSGISQLEALSSLGQQLGALTQFAPLGQFAPFGQLGTYGTPYENIQTKKDEDEDYTDNDVNLLSAANTSVPQNNHKTPSESDSPVPSPPASNNISHSIVGSTKLTTNNANGVNSLALISTSNSGNCNSSSNRFLTNDCNTSISSITTNTVSCVTTSTNESLLTVATINPNDCAVMNTHNEIDNCNANNRIKEHNVLKRKRSFTNDVLLEIKKLNKDARQDSQYANKLLAEANQIEKKKLAIIEEYVRRSLQIQEKMLELQLQRRNFL